jgi:hypothetical protein
MAANLSQTLFDRLVRVMNEISCGDRPQPPCPEEDIGKLQNRANEELGFALPQAYLDLLRLTDGMRFNSVEIFASRRSRLVEPSTEEDRGDTSPYYIPGIIDENLELHRLNPSLVPFLIFGRTETEYLVFDRRSGRYAEISQATNDVYESFEGAEHLLWSAFGRAAGLGPYNSDSTPPPWNSTAART